MRWGWVDTVEVLSKRLDDLEGALATQKSKAPELHEIETMPCLSQNNGPTALDMIQTHTHAPPSHLGRVYVVPFKFSGQIFLRQMSLICASFRPERDAVTGLCLYAMDDGSRVNQLNPRTKSLPSLRKIKRGGWIETHGADHELLTVNFPKGTNLNTGRGLFFAAWTIMSREARVFCPNSVAGSIEAGKSFRASFLTDGMASPDDDFPATLSILDDTPLRAAPCVVGRSLTGLRLFGSFADGL